MTKLFLETETFDAPSTDPEAGSEATPAPAAKAAKSVTEPACPSSSITT